MGQPVRVRVPPWAPKPPRRRSQVVKARVCKTLIRRFDSARRLQRNPFNIYRCRSLTPTIECARFHGSCRGGGMVDAADLKSASRKGVWVRHPPSAPNILYSHGSGRSLTFYFAVEGNWPPLGRDIGLDTLGLTSGLSFADPANF